MLGTAGSTLLPATAEKEVHHHGAAETRNAQKGEEGESAGETVRENRSRQLLETTDHEQSAQRPGEGTG